MDLLKILNKPANLRQPDGRPIDFIHFARTWTEQVHYLKIKALFKNNIFILEWVTVIARVTA